VDLAFIGNNLSLQQVSHIHNFLEEETLLPYFFDCLHMESVENRDLLAPRYFDHIKKYGQILYEVPPLERPE
jgi:hypothetical protein